MTPTDTTRPADGPAPDSGHTDTPDAREGLRGLLGERYEATITRAMKRALFAFPNLPLSFGDHEQLAAEALAAVLPNLLAEAWDEGHRTPWKRGPDECQCEAWSWSECACGLYGSGELLTPNPYRTEGTNS